MRHFALICVAYLTLATLTTGACSSSSDKPPDTPIGPATSGAQSGVHASAQDAANSGNVHVDPKLAKLCSVPNAYFAFDSAHLSAEATKALDSLAGCFVKGPAKKETMRIVGYADQRGEESYNFALGQRRAGSVARVLNQRGVPDDRIESSSQGELEASGTDEAGWAKDRRVEILLAD